MTDPWHTPNEVLRAAHDRLQSTPCVGELPVHDSIRVVFRYDCSRAERVFTNVVALMRGVKLTWADNRRRPKRVAKKIKQRFGVRSFADGHVVRGIVDPARAQ